MSTDIDWTAISAALRAPFAVEDIEFKPGRGGSGALIYIDARAVQDRLDAVVGAGNWSFVWDVMIAEDLPGVKADTKVPENLGTHLRAVRGTLTIHGVPKQEVGNASDIDPDKGAVSDALKRCAVMWGIGRYLYGLKVRDEAEYRTWLQRQGTPARRQPTTPTPLHTTAPPAPYIPAPPPEGDSPDRTALYERLRDAGHALGMDPKEVNQQIRGRFGGPVRGLPLPALETVVEEYERKAADVQGGAA